MHPLPAPGNRLSARTSGVPAQSAGNPGARPESASRVAPGGAPSHRPTAPARSQSQCPADSGWCRPPATSARIEPAPAPHSHETHSPRHTPPAAPTGAPRSSSWAPPPTPAARRTGIPPPANRRVPPPAPNPARPVAGAPPGPWTSRSTRRAVPGRTASGNP
ncbi:Outer membrane protein, OmpA/MotB family [Pseudomonas yamanorum]|nr:Outer membrane protein, OmpA/MotB family [Pseudomonas yamanorum]